MAIALKRPEFEDSKSNIMEPRISKYYHININDNKEEQGSDGYKSESGRYISFFSILQKKSNFLIDPDELTRSLNKHICIPKFGI